MHRGFRIGAFGVLGAIDEPEQVALVEVAEAMHLVEDLGVALQPVHQLPGQFEAQVHPARSQVEQ